MLVMRVYKLWQYFCVYFLTGIVFATIVKSDGPRGISLLRKIFYDPSKDFTCLDGSRTIPFSHVNDDFCDCADGTDEPGTSACPHGTYYCSNKGFKSQNIPSSRVNDGVCDCCDASDEWKNQSSCPNTCDELGRIAKEEHEKKMAEANQGFVVRQEYSAIGKAKKEERQKSLADFEAQLAQLAEVEKVLSQEKEEIEAKETQAKEERRKIMEEELAKKAEQENLARGAKSFVEMDTDKDASLTLSEFLVHTELDPDATDGTFTEEEGLTLLLQKSVDLEQFMDTVWPNINTTFQTAVLPPVEEQEQATEEAHRADKEEEAFREEEDEKQAARDEEADPDDEYFEEENDDDDEDDDGDIDDEDDSEEGLQEPPPPPTGEELYYDDATRAIISEADEARKKYEDHQGEKRKVEHEINALKKALQLDFGEDESFQALQHKCFELSTLEYTYKLCPFEKTTQKPKSGGTETSLGRWGSWSGPANSKYSSMKYENGLGCWNGPSRSTEVKIQCGIENKLLSVDEPSRCTYIMEFATPCACIGSRDQEAGFHDEL